VPVDEVAFAANQAALRAWLADSNKGAATRGDE